MFRPAELPADLADVLGAVRELQAGDEELWSAEVRAAWLSGLQQLIGCRGCEIAPGPGRVRCPW